MTTLGAFLHEQLGQPDEVILYGLGISSVANQNEHELRDVADSLDSHCEVTTYRVADIETERTDIVEDINEIEFEDPSLLLVPDTYGFSMDSLDPVDRYQQFTDLAGDGLQGTLHTDLQHDLDRDAVPPNYRDGELLAYELERRHQHGTTYLINEERLLYLEEEA
ncbi:MAG: hypothetical protein SVU32_02485 [Candidatus Nanohaloarchaea archaeon]|nr:hypothetical protein [Candidatus Nanohaloarchaea archaeon]